MQKATGCGVGIKIRLSRCPTFTFFCLSDSTQRACRIDILLHEVRGLDFQARPWKTSFSRSLRNLQPHAAILDFAPKFRLFAADMKSSAESSCLDKVVSFVGSLHFANTCASPSLVPACVRAHDWTQRNSSEAVWCLSTKQTCSMFPGVTRSCFVVYMSLSELCVNG